jgi:hypothetical protein
MTSQPPIILSSGEPPVVPRRRTNLSLILIVVLGLGTIGFGIASISAYSKATTATKTLNTAKTTAATNAANAQKITDNMAEIQANESPFRTYTAPIAFGSFAINFPKNWMISVDLEDNALSQVIIDLQPDVIRRVNNTQDLYATEITLVRKQITDYTQNLLINKKITEHDVTVAGIASMQFTGALPDNRSTTLVAVPVRDKTLVFSNENAVYAKEFQEILAQAKINP